MDDEETFFSRPLVDTLEAEGHRPAELSFSQLKWTSWSIKKVRHSHPTTTGNKPIALGHPALPVAEVLPIDSRRGQFEIILYFRV